MRTRHQVSPNSKIRPLAAALAVVMGSGAFAGANGTAVPAQPNVLTVKNCQDDGADSLRALIGAAGEGDTIVFDIAQMNCSVITLSSAEIPIIPNSLTVQGPSDGTKITISGGGHYRVFNHVGTGTLALAGVNIVNGYAHAPNAIGGGCVRSEGSVFLNRATVSGCALVADSQWAYGGGVYAQRTSQ
jgi:hypothetical protein